MRDGKPWGVLHDILAKVKLEQLHAQAVQRENSLG